MVDVVFASTNAWGIPNLDPTMQAVSLPAVDRWGRRSRHKSRHDGGAFHFYTEDYKFSALWDNPLPVIVAGAAVAIEPNFSTLAGMPKAVALWGIYKKRWLARFWQSQGIRTIVDLNVEPEFDQINLLGVPSGWRAYATRAYEQQHGVKDLLRQFKIARKRAGSDDLLFAVIGGGAETRKLCDTQGWLHITQENHLVDGRKV